MAWTDPPTYDSLTIPVATANAQWRDNLKLLRNSAQATPVMASSSSGVSFGSDQAVGQQFAIHWGDLALEGTVQWRIIWWLNLSAINGSTHMTMLPRIERVGLAFTGTAAGWMNLPGAGYVETPPTVGLKTGLSAWETSFTPTADGIGVYRLGYNANALTAFPTTNHLGLVLEVRTV